MSWKRDAELNACYRDQLNATGIGGMVPFDVATKVATFAASFKKSVGLDAPSSKDCRAASLCAQVQKRDDRMSVAPDEH